MKLAGPQAHMRVDIRSRDDIRVIIGGIFPPERAPDARRLADVVLRMSENRIKAAIDRAIDAQANGILYGERAMYASLGILHDPRK